jgi:16S rRNA (uracil1498-N3)-methyltransferase
VREVRIYQPGPYRCGQSLELSSTQAQHVAGVLRMQPGEKLTLFCGDDREFAAEITAIHRKKVVVAILSEKCVIRESPKNIHLAQALSKGERMDIVMQKAVELGASSITPIITERCVVKLNKERMEKKRAQWQAIVVAACEQSGRNRVPPVNPICNLEDYFQLCLGPLKFVLHPESPKTWRDYCFAESDIVLLIGPEGGFSGQEMERIYTNHFQSLSLGPRILRTETAAIAALSVLQALCGDL